MSEDVKMWAVNILGIDDVCAVPDKEIADAVCKVLNWQFAVNPIYKNRGDVILKAQVIEWPYGYESWSAEKDYFRLEAIRVKWR